jgi:hypothetical protein
MKKTVIVIAALALILAAEAFVAFVNVPGSFLEEVKVSDSNSPSNSTANSNSNSASNSIATPAAGNNSTLKPVIGTNVSGQNSTEPNVVIDSPKPGEAVTSPLKIKGKIRGGWTFEANFPISIVDWDGLIVGTGHGTVSGDWMTTELVPFETMVTFKRPANIKAGTFSEHGKIIIKKDNPSDLRQYDASVEIPIIFK